MKPAIMRAGWGCRWRINRIVRISVLCRMAAMAILFGGYGRGRLRLVILLIWMAMCWVSMMASLISRLVSAGGLALAAVKMPMTAKAGFMWWRSGQRRGRWWLARNPTLPVIRWHCGTLTGWPQMCRHWGARCWRDCAIRQWLSQQKSQNGTRRQGRQSYGSMCRNMA